MKMEVLSVFDTASGVFARPIFVASIGAGSRMFADEVNRKAQDNVMSQHPEDFQLFHLGSWDDVTAEYFPVGQPVRITTGTEVVI